MAGGLPILSKISACSLDLVRWGYHRARDFKAQIKKCKDKMHQLRGKRDEVSLTDFIEARDRYNELLHSHEVYWKHRSKTFWLRDGDSNSKFFHAMASTRKCTNTLIKLRNQEGQWCTNPEDVNNLICEYFTTLFTAGICSYGDVLNCVESKITDAQNQSLLEPFAAEDVQSAVFDMQPDKSPGPDGMNPAFYQKFWNVVGTDITEACFRFIRDCSFPDGLNETSIVFIPKKKQIEFLTDVRPISLCNVLYKIVAKMLANRMKMVLGLIISDSQSAFVLGRAIADNVLISAEIMHFLKRKLTYKITLEELELGPIVPSRGLRQGDPLSPYLFIICAEGLSLLINHYERAGMIHGARVARGAPLVSHLFFADDCFLFFKATVHEAHLVKKILATYEAASGQQVNYNKSSVSFSRNMVEDTIHNICQQLGVVATIDHGTYLGLPSYVGHKKIDIFRYIKDKVWQRIQGWHQKLLSRAGKEILIKIVAQAIPNYAMQVYLLPLDLCRDLGRMMNSFWWGSKRYDSGGIKWMQWGRLCKPKSYGGIGFKHIHKFNVAMLGRQGWRLITNPSSLVGRLYKAWYYPNADFTQAKLGSNPSYAWQSILAAQKILIQGSRVQVGNGQSITIGSVPWLPDQESGFITTNLPAMLASAPVSSLMIPNHRMWDYDLVKDVFNRRDQDCILQIPLSSRSNCDTWYWLPDAKGIYTVRSCYKWMDIISEPPGSGVWSKIWKLAVPAKIKNFLWRAVANVVPTADNLLSRRVEAECLKCSIKLVKMFQWQKARQLSHFTQMPADLTLGSVCWKRPRFGWFKCNVGAATSRATARISYGAVIRSSEDNFLAAKCGSLIGIFEAREAEALGVREDYQNGFGLIISDCRALAHCLKEMTFSFVRRSANTAAHIVAKVECSLSGPSEWRHVPPPWLFSHLSV
ncbi:reverse transcriptase domain-containing protein [Citrus sinensis]|uniref:Reverse transcriptase domain-containing protein n=1 Tax=Citrus sinensis TaxID=2711 RepID=A0ACB8L220_CITSI|nr:reverse transcriptase domain-containing protein [Citrus sinensis]